MELIKSISLFSLLTVVCISPGYGCIQRVYNLFYKKSLQEQVVQSYHHFQRVNVTPNSAIICNVACLGLDGSTMHRKSINLIQELYRALVKRGFKIIFITSQSTAHAATIHQQLIDAQYHTFHQLICMPTEMFNNLAIRYRIENLDAQGLRNIIKIWYAQQQEALAGQYDIIGIIDYSENMLGKNTGYQVQIPMNITPSLT